MNTQGRLSRSPSLGARAVRHWRFILAGGAVGIVLAGGILSAIGGPPAITTATASPNNPLPDRVLAWDSRAKETNVVGGAADAHFVFDFTNRSSGSVVIQNLQPSCGCTTAQLPALPWVIPAGGSGRFGLTVNLLGKARRRTETAIILTDRGYQEIFFNVNILPPVVPARSSAERRHDREIATANRQAIFHGDCVTCHRHPGQGQDGKALYYSACAICHESKDAVSSMPDLFAIKTPANVTFWLDWIAHGKPGSLMPAFSTADGGPLTEMQIANLARFLNTSDNLDASDRQ
jgi:mono/diheme cytochrome c family protein